MGSIASGFAAQDAADAQRAEGRGKWQIENRNAGIADTLSLESSRKGDYEAGITKMKGSNLIGTQKAEYGASGVSVDVGSPMDAMLDTRIMSDVDAATIKNKAAREAWGYQVKAQQDREQAKLSLLGAVNSAKATESAATANEVGEATSIAGKILAS